MSKYDEGIEVEPISRSDLRRLTCLLRKQLGIEDAEPFPVMTFLELVLPKVFDDFTLVIKTRAEMGNKHGETFPRRHCITLREDVYLGACAGKGRDLYTVAHEIGHLFLHAGHYSFARRGIGSFPIFKNSEWQADAFAGELLMPYSQIRNMITEQVQATYGVSPSAAKAQLRAIRR